MQTVTTNTKPNRNPGAAQLLLWQARLANPFARAKTREELGTLVAEAYASRASETDATTSTGRKKASGFFERSADAYQKAGNWRKAAEQLFKGAEHDLDLARESEREGNETAGRGFRHDAMKKLFYEARNLSNTGDAENARNAAEHMMWAAAIAVERIGYYDCPDAYVDAKATRFFYLEHAAGYYSEAGAYGAKLRVASRIYSEAKDFQRECERKQDEPGNVGGTSKRKYYNELRERAMVLAAKYERYAQPEA